MQQVLPFCKGPKPRLFREVMAFSYMYTQKVFLGLSGLHSFERRQVSECKGNQRRTGIVTDNVPIAHVGPAWRSRASKPPKHVIVFPTSQAGPWIAILIWQVHTTRQAIKCRTGTNM